MTTQTTRWTPRRKAVVVADVRRGNITFDEACRKYEITIDEFAGWFRNLSDYGIRGLRVTRRVG